MYYFFVLLSIQVLFSGIGLIWGHYWGKTTGRMEEYNEIATSLKTIRRIIWIDTKF